MGVEVAKDVLMLGDDISSETFLHIITIIEISVYTVSAAISAPSFFF